MMAANNIINSHINNNGVISESLLMDLLLILLVTSITIYYYSIKTFSYYKKRNVKYAKDLLLPFFGNTYAFSTGKKNISIVHKELYNHAILKDEKLAGIFINRLPILMIRDPVLIQHMLVKDFSYFYNRGTIVDENVDPLHANLLNLTGTRWKSLRQKLTPAFSTGKLKIMFQLFNECANELVNHLGEQITKRNPIEILEIMAKFSTDVIGTCAFGLQFNSLKDPNSEFRTMGRDIFKPSIRSKIRLLLRLINDRLPFILGFKQFKKEHENFFLDLVKTTIEYREKNEIERKDLIQILMSLRKQDDNVQRMKNNNEKSDHSHNSSNNSQQDSENYSSNNKLELNDKLLAANSFLFFVAGFETSSATLTYCLYELAMNYEIQDRLRYEIKHIIKENNTNDKHEISHEVLKQMNYLDQVLSETLRKYPVAGSFMRKCTKLYNIPNTRVTLYENERIVIPVLAIHHDPKYYPEPEKFDPERFTDENKNKRQPGTYLPFGDGPRMCIGMRFAQLVIKVAVVKILLTYSLRLSNKTQVPFIWKPRSLLLPEGGVWLNLEPLEEKIHYQD